MLERISSISAEQGFLMTFAVVVLAGICYGLSYVIRIAMDDWKAQKKIDRAEKQKDREIARESNKQYAQIIENQAIQIERSTASIRNYQMELGNHTKRSENSFKEVSDKLDSLDSKVQEIGRRSKALATKEMVEDISTDINSLRETLKKD